MSLGQTLVMRLAHPLSSIMTKKPHATGIGTVDISQSHMFNYARLINLVSRLLRPLTLHLRQILHIITFWIRDCPPLHCTCPRRNAHPAAKIAGKAVLGKVSKIVDVYGQQARH